MQQKILQLQYKFSNTYFIKYTISLYLSYTINQIVTFLIPLVTFVLFLEEPTILGFILNCLTAIFLIELDDITAVANCGSMVMEHFVYDTMIIKYIQRGLKTEHFIKNLYKNSFISSIILLSSIFQLGLMFFLSIYIGFCL